MTGIVVKAAHACQSPLLHSLACQYGPIVAASHIELTAQREEGVVEGRHIAPLVDVCAIPPCSGDTLTEETK
jgi:hypothetical protein